MSHRLVMGRDLAIGDVLLAGTELYRPPDAWRGHAAVTSITAFASYRVVELQDGRRVKIAPGVWWSVEDTTGDVEGGAR